MTEELQLSGPLVGYKIIDLSRAGPGRMATGLLADYGADVISIVEPGYAERFAQNNVKVTHYFTTNKRNKRSLFLNLKAEAGKKIFIQLIKRSNALLESNRPGVTKRLGIDYDSLKQVNPALVYCSLSGFGQYGPYRDIPAYNLTFQGVGGQLPLDENGRPHMTTYILGDINAARNAATAILMGLLYQARSGVGQYIDVAFSDGCVTIPPGRVEDDILPEQQGKLPGVNIYPTKDGRYIALSIREPWYWERFCRLFEREEWISQPKPDDKLGKEMISYFSARFQTKTLAEWFTILRENDLEFGPANTTIEQLVNDPHITAREMVLKVTDPISGQEDYEAGFALKFAQTPAKMSWGPTPLGKDTNEILKELDYRESDIHRLKEEGVI